MPHLSDALLYAILDTGYVDEARAEHVTAALLDGGAGILQLRAKNWPMARVAHLAQRLLPLCRASGVPFIINDHPHIARDVGADGVHIGQDDGSLESVRAVVGPNMVVGRSTHSVDQAVAAAAEGFDYLGFGPLFPTATKPGRPAIGMDHLAVVHERIQIPIFAIGGVNLQTLEPVLAAGAKRVVIVSALLCADDVAAETRKVLAIMRQNPQSCASQI